MKFDVEEVKRRLERIMPSAVAERMKFVGALLPWFEEELMKNGLAAVGKRLTQLLDPEDWYQMYETLRIAMGDVRQFLQR